MSTTPTATPLAVRESGEANEFFLLDSKGHWMALVRFNGELVVEKQKANIERISRAYNAHDDLALKATHYEWLLNEARKTGVTVRFVNDGKDMCVGGGIIEESLVDDLVKALQAFVDTAGIMDRETGETREQEDSQLFADARAALTKAGAQ